MLVTGALERELMELLLAGCYSEDFVPPRAAGLLHCNGLKVVSAAIVSGRDDKAAIY